MIKYKKPIFGSFKGIFMKEEYLSKSVGDTVSFADRFSSSLSFGDCVALYGDLGTGKTHFVKGVAAGLGYTGEVTSPTFNIVNEYKGGRLDLYHFDMYRITGWDDLDSTGYFEYLESGGVVIAEWSENIENALPENAIRVRIERIDDNTRKITIER